VARRADILDSASTPGNSA
jgi:hypothetical protein